MTLIDTSAWIEFFRSKGDTALKSRVADLISFGEAAYTCPIRFELFLGARAKELKDLQIGLGFARRVMLAPQHWNTAAALGAKLRSAGHSIPASDLLIAVVAHSEDLPLLARDRRTRSRRARSFTTTNDWRTAIAPKSFRVSVYFTGTRQARSSIPTRVTRVPAIS
jgi:predicted nucleic acid-binding protein